MIILKISINGNFFADSSLDYEKVHQIVNDNSYDSIGDAVISKISDAIHQSEWYHRTPQNFDLVHNFNDVQAVCGDNAVCYMDSLNWSIMNKSELTADIYRFIADKMNVIRVGIQDNFIPDHHLTFGGLLDMIDWHFILDCISWFL